MRRLIKIAFAASCISVMAVSSLASAFEIVVENPSRYRLLKFKNGQLAPTKERTRGMFEIEIPKSYLVVDDETVDIRASLRLYRKRTPKATRRRPNPTTITRGGKEITYFPFRTDKGNVRYVAFAHMVHNLEKENQERGQKTSLNYEHPRTKKIITEYGKGIKSTTPYAEEAGSTTNRRAKVKRSPRQQISIGSLGSCKGKPLERMPRAVREKIYKRRGTQVKQPVTQYYTPIARGSNWAAIRRIKMLEGDVIYRKNGRMYYMKYTGKARPYLPSKGVPGAYGPSVYRPPCKGFATSLYYYNKNEVLFFPALANANKKAIREGRKPPYMCNGKPHDGYFYAVDTGSKIRFHRPGRFDFYHGPCAAGQYRNSKCYENNSESLKIKDFLNGLRDENGRKTGGKREMYYCSVKKSNFAVRKKYFYDRPRNSRRLCRSMRADRSYCRRYRADNEVRRGRSGPDYKYQ